MRADSKKTSAMQLWPVTTFVKALRDSWALLAITENLLTAMVLLLNP